MARKRLKKILLVSFALLMLLTTIIITTFPILAPVLFASQLEFRPTQYGVWVEHSVLLIASDDVKLVANIYHGY